MSTPLATAPGQYLRADAAASFDRVNAGRRWTLTDSERPVPKQIEIFEDRYPSLVSLGVPDRRGPWKGRYWWRRPGVAAAAVPGTSLHGSGIAIDVRDLGRVGSKAWQAFRDAAEPHGWRHPAWAKRSVTYEPWHWEYDPALDQHKNRPAPAAVPVPDVQEDDMVVILNKATNGAILVSGGRSAPIIGWDMYQTLAKELPTVGVSNAQYAAIVAAFPIGAPA